MFKRKEIFITIIIIILNIVLFIVILSTFFGNRAGCSENEGFYKNELHNKIKEIKTDSFQDYKGISYYYIFDDIDSTIYFQNTQALPYLINFLEVGDSFVKYRDSENFIIYRNNSIYREMNYKSCDCYYCK